MAGSAVSWLGSTLVVCAAVTACSASPSGTASSSTAPSSDTTTSMSSTTSDTPSSSTTASTSATSATSAPTTSGATAPGPSAAGEHGCGNHDLTVALGRSRVAAGHVGVAVVFHNVTHTSCRLFGYPGVAGLDTQGRQIAQATRTTTGYLGGGSYVTRTVVLPAGGSASALVEGSDVPSGGQASCPTFSALLVTAPGQTASHVLRESFPGCATFQVHPVVAGVDGGA